MGITACCSRARERGTTSQWQADEVHEEARGKEKSLAFERYPTSKYEFLKRVRGFEE
jgi:hypothetical protein